MLNRLSVTMLILPFSVALLVSGCVKSFPPKQFVEYYDTMGLKGAETVERNGYRMSISYRPGDYFAAREMNFDSTQSGKMLRDRYAKAIYLIAKIEPVAISNEKNDPLPAENLLDKNDIMERIYNKKEEALLVKGTDTVKAADCRYERDWENATVGTYVLAFKKNDKKFKNYNLILRGFKTELGTVVVPLAKLIKNSVTLRG